MIRNLRINTKTKQIIQDIYPSLSSLQQSIADFFLENTEMMDFSSKRISKILYVSEPTLSRFAQKCNFKGYREFIYEYSNDLLNVNPTDDHQAIQIKENIQSEYFELIQNNCKDLATQDFEHLQILLDNAKRIFVFGEGYASMLAYIFQYRLSKFGYDIETISAMDRLRLRYDSIHQDDLFIYILLQDHINLSQDDYNKILVHKPYSLCITSATAKIPKGIFTELYQLPVVTNALYSPSIPYIMFIDLLANYIQCKTQ